MTSVADLKPGDTFTLVCGNDQQPRQFKVRSIQAQNFRNAGTQEVTVKYRINSGTSDALILDADHDITTN